MVRRSEELDSGPPDFRGADLSEIMVDQTTKLPK
jgi:hypothetical protein